jgi:O-antigen/teichoic acid export membrane protein
VTQCAEEQSVSQPSSQASFGSDTSSPAGGSPSPSALSRLSSALAAPLLLAVVVQNIANFAFHAVVGRTLPPGDYGALGAVLAVMVLLSVPLMALQASASALVSGSGWDTAVVRRTLGRVAAAGVAVGLLVLAAAGAVQSYFHLASALDAAVLAPFVTVSILLAVTRGLLLGDGRVTTTAMTYLVGTAARFGFGVLLVLSFGVTGALVGTLLGEVAALLAATLPVLRRCGAGDPTASLRVGDLALSGFAVTGLFLFSTVDLLMARHYLPDAATGSYTAAATIGKTVLALPAAVIGVYFPRLVIAWRAGDSATLRRAVIVVCGLAFAGAAVVVAVPGLLLHLLYGPEGFADAAGLVRLLAVVAGLTSVVSVLTYAALARRGRSLLVPWVGAVVEVALIVHTHATTTDIARASLVALLPTVVVMAVWEGLVWRRAARPSARGRHERPVLADVATS